MVLSEEYLISGCSMAQECAYSFSSNSLAALIANTACVPLHIRQGKKRREIELHFAIILMEMLMG